MTKTIRKIVSRLQWTVSAECKIGIFSFLKINMYRDLKDNAEKILENPNVCQLLGEPIELQEEEENEGTVDDPLIELHSVVDADSSQMEAIEMAKSGKSCCRALREQEKARRSRISLRNVSAMGKKYCLCRRSWPR